MVCALIAHAAVYRSLVPDDGLHGYFGWYVPLVAVATVCSLLAVMVGGLGPRSRAARLIQSCLPARSRTRHLGTVVGLASGGLAVLVVQESLERSLGAGAFTLVSFDASMWPVLLVVLVLAAALVLGVGRTAIALGELVFNARRRLVRMTRVLSHRGTSPGVDRKSALLGWHAGSRAPPLVV